MHGPSGRGANGYPPLSANCLASAAARSTAIRFRSSVLSTHSIKARATSGPLTIHSIFQ